MGQVGTQLGRVVERTWARQDLERLADELAVSNRELERSNTELESFASVASHDLSEPVRTAAAFITLLRERYGERLDERALGFIGHAESSLRRMHTMIDDLLDYARAGASRGPYEPVSLREVAVRALDLLAPRIAEAEAEIILGDQPTVSCDPGELARVFQNLIANALKFARPGVRPRLEIATVRTHNEWLISITDNGIGVAEADRDRIFAMFQRLDRGSGSGIGLAVCTKVVATHGGRIWVEPAPSGGSVFCFTLPADVGLGTTSS
jgi:light-regulated signal transduction histidine kinase (bacteriophytochrome)